MAVPRLFTSPIDYRCDDTLAGQGAGCVFPKFSPTLTTMTELPAIAANIRRIQNRGPGHYGRPGGGHPLHRLVNPARQRKNHDAVCGKNVVGPPPKGKSCDEYPFRSTYEGGTALSKANRGWAWVPVEEQTAKVVFSGNSTMPTEFWITTRSTSRYEAADADAESQLRTGSAVMLIR